MTYYTLLSGSFLRHLQKEKQLLMTLFVNELSK